MHSGGSSYREGWGPPWGRSDHPCQYPPDPLPMAVRSGHFRVQITPFDPSQRVVYTGQTRHPGPVPKAPAARNDPQMAVQPYMLKMTIFRGVSHYLPRPPKGGQFKRQNRPLRASPAKPGPRYTPKMTPLRGAQGCLQRLKTPMKSGGK